MDATLSFKTHVFDITSVLDSKTLMGEIRGHDAWGLLRDQVKSLPSTEGLLLDMSAAAMLDYGFSEFAFGSLFGDTQLQPICRQIIFVLAPSSRNAFFEGILKATHQPRKSYSQSQDMFIEAGYCCKVAPHRKGALEFVGQLSDDEKAVLDSVNHLKSGAIENIVAHSSLRPEKVHDDLRALAGKGFVMEHQAASYLSYLSYYNFLESSES